MDINPEDETSYTTEYHETFLQYVEIEYSTKYWGVTVIKPKSIPSNNLFPSTTAVGSGQSSCDPYALSSNTEEYSTPNNEAEMTPGQSDRVSRILTIARLYLNSSPEVPKHWGQISQNHNASHSDQMEISSTFWIPDITDWWRQQEETY